MELKAGDLFAFTYPVVGGSHTARVLSISEFGMIAARIIGFPLPGAYHQVGETVAVDPKWVNQAEPVVTHREGLVAFA